MGCSGSKGVKRTFLPIPDRFKTIDEVTRGIREAGVESSNLILGVDFTKSNTWTGTKSYGGRCLHAISPPGWEGPQCPPNPYSQVIEILAKTLADFDEDHLIPAYGFGDSTTKDKQCFSFHEHNRPSNRVDEALCRYHQLCHAVGEEKIVLSGPTSFGPVIQEAIKTVVAEQSYHILVIIADGQVSDPKPNGPTARAIVLASKVALSIVVVGVGDGPWEAMEEFDDRLPERDFDNFQFVQFNKIRADAKNLCRGRSGEEAERFVEAQFALHALMEIPDQFKFIMENDLLDRVVPSDVAAMIAQRAQALHPCPVPEGGPAAQDPAPQPSRSRAGSGIREDGVARFNPGAVGGSVGGGSGGRSEVDLDEINSRPLPPEAPPSYRASSHHPVG